MADTIRDISRWLNEPALHPENMTTLLVTLAQGPFVLEDILPVIPTSDEFKWLTEDYNDQFTLARRRGEGGEASKNEVFDTQNSGSAYEYFEGADITAKTLRSNNVFDFVSQLVRKTGVIANKIRMNVERDGILALTNTSLYSTINTRSGTVLWTTTASSDPYKDILLAVNQIATTEHVEADAIILGATDKTNMVLSDNIRDTIQYTKNYLSDGTPIENVAGLRLFVSNTIYKSGSTNVPLLSGTGIVLSTGIAGELREAQPYIADSDFEKKVRTLTLLGSRVIAPIITHPKAITLINNVS